MPERTADAQQGETRDFHIRYRYRGRFAQVGIYLGKLFRMMVYQNDWKVLPMSALIAGVVGLVIQTTFIRTMDGTLRAGFILSCVALWNGCFNSIQAICRERNIIKREHRAGMHISSYVLAHMLYQAVLCLLQTGMTMYILRLMKVSFPAEGIFTKWMIVDMGITVFLITYASDMMALLISSVVRSTTMAMTVMPFMLIFQLVFAGGVIPLPDWGMLLSDFTITHYGIQCLCAQADLNNRPLTMVWDTLYSMRNEDIQISVSAVRIMDMLSDDSNPIVAELRSVDPAKEADPVRLWQMLEETEYWQELRKQEIDSRMTLKELVSYLQSADNMKPFRDTELGLMTVGDLLDLLSSSLASSEIGDTPVGRTMTVGELEDLLQPEKLLQGLKDTETGKALTVGDLIDLAAAAPEMQAQRDRQFTVTARVGDLIDLVGRKELRDYVISRTSAASRNAIYDQSEDTIVNCWIQFIFFIILFSGLSVLALEFIDRDKR